MDMCELSRFCDKQMQVDEEGDLVCECPFLDKEKHKEDNFCEFVEMYPQDWEDDMIIWDRIQSWKNSEPKTK
jgi:hypothetical protein